MPSEHPNAAQSKRRRGRPPIIRNFYGDALDRAQRVLLDQAHESEGLRDEIDMLRVKLFEAVQEKEVLPVLFRGLDVLIRLVTAQYRLSPQASKDLAEHLSATLRALAEQFYPEGVDAA